MHDNIQAPKCATPTRFEEISTGLNREIERIAIWKSQLDELRYKLNPLPDTPDKTRDCVSAVSSGVIGEFQAMVNSMAALNLDIEGCLKDLKSYI